MGLLFSKRVAALLASILLEISGGAALAQVPEQQPEELAVIMAQVGQPELARRQPASVDEALAELQAERLKREEALRHWLFVALVMGSITGAALFLMYRSKLRANHGLTELNMRLGHQQEALRAANDELARLNREMNEVLAVVSHDLKNPLVGIEGLSHEMRSMAEAEGDNQQAHMLAMIESSAHRMFLLVTDLLDLQRIEVGQHGLVPAPVNIVQLVNAIVTDFSSVASEKAQDIETDLPESAWVMGDESALARVVSNLVSNALKYSPQGTSVHIALRYEAGVTLEVTDQGPGIPPEEAVKLFRKFSRLSTRPTGGESSTGLGLAISKGIIDALGGRIWCRSTAGKGATFGFSLPVAREPSSTSMSASGATH